jgi:uncharacterized protein
VLAGGLPEASNGIALLTDRTTVNGRPTAYLCHSYVCEAPATWPEDLASQIHFRTRKVHFN